MEQYVIQDGRRHRIPLRKRTKRIEVIGWLLCLVLPASSALVWYFAGPTNLPSPIANALLWSLWVAFLLGLGLIIATNIVSAWTSLAGKRKRKRIYEAIDRASSSFAAARKHQWLVTLGTSVCFAVLIVITCWEVLSQRHEIYAYFSQQPARLLYVAAIALVVGLASPVGRAAWKCWGPRDDGDEARR